MGPTAPHHPGCLPRFRRPADAESTPAAPQKLERLIHDESFEYTVTEGGSPGMIVMDNNLKAIHKEALQRQARQRVDLIDEMRAAKNAADRKLPQRDIADLLATS